MFKFRKSFFKPFALISVLIMTAALFSGCEISFDTDAAVSEFLQDTNTYVYSQTEPDSQPSYDSSQEVSGNKEAYDDTSSQYAVYYTFRKEKYLNEHFEKHNNEFGYDDAQEYLDGANRVINDKNALHKIEAEDGDDVYYLENTNEFVIVSKDGYIRTYFKPSGGIEYFNRQ